MSRDEEFENKAKKYLHHTNEFFDLKIKDVMKKRSWDIPIIIKDAEILDVLAMLCTNDHLWVVDNLDNNEVIGLITEHDILHALRPIKKHRFFGVPSRRGLGLALFEVAEHIMSHDPITCTPNDKVGEILQEMEAHGIRRIPVVKSAENEIISEVTIHQLIKEFYSAVKPFCEICGTEKCEAAGSEKS